MTFMKMLKIKPRLAVQYFLGYHFTDYKLLDEALTHSSLLDKNSKKHSNERLEFLGDAVLDLTVSTLLFQTLSTKDEGHLTIHRSKLVNEKMLASLAKNLKLGEMLKVQKGTVVTDSILADTLEALIGAIYLDGGLDAVTMFVKDIYGAKLYDVDTKMDDKSELQKLTSRHLKTLPSYRIVYQYGPDHQPTFQVEAKVITAASTYFSFGEGFSVKEAEQAAASTMLTKLKKESVV